MIINGRYKGYKGARRGIANLALVSSSWTTIPMCPGWHGLWAGLMRIVVYELLESSRLVTMGLEDWTYPPFSTPCLGSACFQTLSPQPPGCY